MKRLLIICLAVVCLSACKDSLIKPYHGVDNIYFENVLDSMAISFGLVPNKEDSLIQIPVKITGKIADVDRKYKVKILDSSTAEEGVHFDYHDEDFTIAAGEYMDFIQITLHNTSDLVDSSVYVAFKLLPNKYFSTKLKYHDTAEGLTSYTTYKLYATHDVQPPAWWIPVFFGRFTVKKYLLMGEVLDIDMSTFIQYFDRARYFAFVMPRYLDSEAAKGNIIYEEDGTRMTMGPIAN